jgi:hypothetical protein
VCALYLQERIAGPVLVVPREVSKDAPGLGWLPYWRIMKYVMCLLIVVSLFAFAQVPAMPDASGLRSDRKAPAFPVAVLQPAPFEFRGIRIGDEMKEAERRFLSWKIPSLSSTPGLCGSDGINRIETCTDVLDTGQYVNMTMLDQKVAQIYVSTDNRTQGNTYNSYVLALAKKYGTPDKPETRQKRNGLVNEFPGERILRVEGRPIHQSQRDRTRHYYRERVTRCRNGRARERAADLKGRPPTSSTSWAGISRSDAGGGAGHNLVNLDQLS